MKLEELKNLNVLSKTEQKAIDGGVWTPVEPVILCFSDNDCPNIPGFGDSQCRPINGSVHRFCHVDVPTQ